MFALVSDNLRRALQDRCRELQIPRIPVLDPVMAALRSYLGIQNQGQPGRQHEVDSEYFERSDAMTFALNHDDGQAVWDLRNDAVIMLDVSRTSKTPASIYLPSRGVKTGNIPIVPIVPLPKELFQLSKAGLLIVGLTKEVESLVQIRRNRLRLLCEDYETDYIDPETVREEVAIARRLCTKNGWPIIDVTRRLIEESVASIMQMMENRA